MAYELQIQKNVDKYLARLGAADRFRALRAFEEIRRDPFWAGKPLHGERAGQYSYRIGPYRIIYRVEKNLLIIIIIDLGPRGDIY